MFYRKDPKQQQNEINKEPTPSEIRYGVDPSCFEVHEKWELPCDVSSCRNYIKYESDLNCAVVCARKHDNGLSLREVAERMGVSFPRISQIEHAAFKKLKDAGVFQQE
tara:strand:- start:82 stop:405 length:324 start_codon:yes stop_codon:yes gene_type:complete